MRKRNSKIVLELPDQFLDLCDQDMIQPDRVLQGFIADLCSIYDWQPGAYKYITNGSDERSYARAYYDRVGYPYFKDCPEHREQFHLLQMKSEANSNGRDRQKGLTLDKRQSEEKTRHQDTR